MARPTDFRREYIRQARRLCMLGATDAEMAEFFGCAIPTFYRWVAYFPGFRKALKMGKDSADSRVERSLYNRAVGYTCPDVHVSNFQGQVTITPIQKHYPPDVAAAFIWLKNRRPEQWRDKQEIAHTGLDSFAEELKLARARAGIQEEAPATH